MINQLYNVRQYSSFFIFFDKYVVDKNEWANKQTRNKKLRAIVLWRH